MEILSAVFFLLVGFLLLVKGADFFVEGSSGVAVRLKVPSIIIGLTIVSMGTSLPETAVSTVASVAGNNELAISNVTGSNIFNLMVVIGVCALMTPVMVQKVTVKRDIPLSVVCALLLIGMAAVDILMGSKGMSLGHIDGVILLVCFIFFILTMVRSAQKARKEGNKVEQTEEADAKELLPVWRCVVYIVGGAAAIVLGGDWVVDGASTIAMKLGMSQTLVGLTIVSIGTSLPELVTSVVAARKKEVDMALGNAIGSNIFNILMILGIAATISPISFTTENLIDLGVLCVFSLLVWLFAYTRQRISKLEGGSMVLFYAVYAVYIVMRDMN